MARTTLADANEQRDWRLWEDLAKTLMRKARALYAEEPRVGKHSLCARFDNHRSVVTLFPWADFRRTKAGIKMTPNSICEGRFPPASTLPAPVSTMCSGSTSSFEPGAFYVMDRGYMDKIRRRLCREGLVLTHKQNPRSGRTRAIQEEQKEILRFSVLTPEEYKTVVSSAAPWQHSKNRGGTKCDKTNGQEGSVPQPKICGG